MGEGYAVGSYLKAQTNSAGTLNAPTPVDESASWIRDAVGMSEQQLSEIHECINLLERRLDTVLTPAPPSVQGGSGGIAPKQSPPNVSHLRGRIVILNEGWQHATNG